MEPIPELKEIITEPNEKQEIIFAIPKDIHRIPYDEDDPFALCSDCKEIGFCRKEHPKEFEVERKLLVELMQKLLK